jgi:dipeptide/tripeptide permease
MNTFTRWIAVVVAVLGVVSLVFGIIFITQASSAERQIASEIQPLKIAEVDAKYEAVKTNQTGLAQAEEPQIQAGKAAPSAMYNYLTIQRTSLGLARANIGLVGFTRTSGIINIIVGLGLILAGVGLFKKNRSVA